MSLTPRYNLSPAVPAIADAYEVDFLRVGEGEKSGDAIAIRFWVDHSAIVVIVDGGYRDVGEDLVEHVRRHYETNSVDLVVSSHSDGDHLNGLAVVLDEMDVGELFMHRPWRHGLNTGTLFASRRIVTSAMRSRFQASLTAACDLEHLAQRRGIPITEPFAGVERFGGRLRVAGPSLEYYESLLTDFRCQLAGRFPPDVFTKLAELDRVVPETPERETLTDEGTTSAENNSSVILQLTLAGRRQLFTADAGIPALSQAAGYLDAYGHSAAPLDFIQVPHHGSHHNVGSTILNCLLGLPAPRTAKTTTAFISASEADPDHPARKVVNAFARRRCQVYSTEGRSIHHSYGAPDRPGWTPIVALPFYSQVEE